jgi:hypothetical protein
MMKYIKLTIILLVIAGALGGIITLITKGKVSGDVKPEPTDVKTRTIEKRIHDDIETASENSFCATAYSDILNTIDLFFESEPSNKATYTLKLQGAYCRKFVRQANAVFDGTRWEHSEITTIRKELNRCMEFFPEDKGLDSIRQILLNYANLVRFDTEVKNACKQQPRCLNDHIYLYQPDNWDIATTQRLLSNINIPNPSGKVRNSPVYQRTRQDKVRRRLKDAHTQFIQLKMERSKLEAESYNYNPARQGDYNKLGERLYECFQSYAKQWDSTNEYYDEWKPAVDRWGQYVEPLENNNY